MVAKVNVHRLPKQLLDPGTLYIRTTAVPRTLESVQQMLQSLCPGDTKQTLTPWDIAMRAPAEETLYPNRSCARLAELSRAFAQRAAEKWNGSDDMAYLSERLGQMDAWQQNVGCGLSAPTVSHHGHRQRNPCRWTGLGFPASFTTN